MVLYFLHASFQATKNFSPGGFHMKEKQLTTYHLALTGIFAALIAVFTAFFCHIPVGVNGGYIHFGDAIIYLAASLLPLPYAMAAGAIGGGLADLATAPLWAPATVIIKMLIVLPLTSKQPRILCRRNMAAPVLSFLISGTGYFLAEALLFGTKTAFISSISGSFLQSFGSAVFFYLLGSALDKSKIKQLLFSANSRCRA